MKYILFLLIPIIAFAQVGNQKIRYQDLERTLERDIRRFSGDPTLTGLDSVGVYDYINTYMRLADTTAMKAWNDTTNGRLVNLRQLSTSNSNGGGFFTVIDSTYPEYGGVVFDHVTQGKQWININFMENPHVINIRDFGAVADYYAGGDSSDNYTAINNAINFLVDSKIKGGTIYFPGGRYGVASTIHKPSQVNFKGQKGQENHVGTFPSSLDWIGSSGDTMIVMNSTDGVFNSIEYMVIRGNDSCDIGIYYNYNPDLGDGLNYIQIQSFRKYGIYLSLGATNFHMDHFRFDGIGWTGAAGGAGDLSYVDSAFCVYTKANYGMIAFNEFTIDTHAGGFLYYDSSSTSNIYNQHISINNGYVEINENMPVPNSFIFVNMNTTSNPQFSVTNLRKVTAGGITEPYMLKTSTTESNHVGLNVFHCNWKDSLATGLSLNPVNKYRNWDLMIQGPYSTVSAYRSGSFINAPFQTTNLILGHDSVTTPVANISIPLQWAKAYSLIGTPVANAVEYDGDYMYLTDSSGTRNTIGYAKDDVYAFAVDTALANYSLAVQDTFYRLGNYSFRTSSNVTADGNNRITVNTLQNQGVYELDYQLTLSISDTTEFELKMITESTRDSLFSSINTVNANEVTTIAGKAAHYWNTDGNRIIYLGLNNLSGTGTITIYNSSWSMKRVY